MLGREFLDLAEELLATGTVYSENAHQLASLGLAVCQKVAYTFLTGGQG